MSSRRLVSHVLPVREVGVSLRDELFALMRRCYHCVTRERFESDLLEKDYIVLLRDASEVPRGFSTQRIDTREWEGLPIRVLFSGDTVVEPEFWGSHELVKGWCEVAAMFLRQEPKCRLFWFLISKGYRTYLYLPLFFREYHPRCEGAASDETGRLLDALAEEKFGDFFDRASGIVRFPQSLGQLTPEFAEVPDVRRADRHVQYFLARNPGCFRGDELVCLAEVSLENTHKLGRRWLKRALYAVSAHD